MCITTFASRVQLNQPAEVNKNIPFSKLSYTIFNYNIPLSLRPPGPWWFSPWKSLKDMLLPIPNTLWLEFKSSTFPEYRSRRYHLGFKPGYCLDYSTNLTWFCLLITQLCMKELTKVSILLFYIYQAMGKVLNSQIFTLIQISINST